MPLPVGQTIKSVSLRGCCSQHKLENNRLPLRIGHDLYGRRDCFSLHLHQIRLSLLRHLQQGAGDLLVCRKSGKAAALGHTLFHFLDGSRVHARRSEKGSGRVPAAVSFDLPVAVGQPAGSRVTVISAGTDDSHFLLVPPDLRREVRVC